MGLTICNSYPSDVWVAIMFYSPETCGGEGKDFEMMGWWNIHPGACAFVYANDLENAFWYIFAFAGDRAVWAGPFAATVPREVFGGDQWCWGVQHSITAFGEGEPAVSIGFREFNFGDSEDATVTLIA